MRELNVNEIKEVNGGKGKKGSNSGGSIVDTIADEIADLVDVVNGIIDGFKGNRENDPNPETKK